MSITSDVYALKNDKGEYFTGVKRKVWSDQIRNAKLYKQEAAMKNAIKDLEAAYKTAIQPVRICMREVGKLSTYE